MQKSMWLTAALWFSLFISGCGSSTTTSVVASTPDVLTASDIYVKAGKTLYVTSPKGTTYTTFHTYSGATKHDWNYDPSDTTTKVGVWTISGTDGKVVFYDSSPSPTAVKTITGIQKVYTDTAKATLGYWLAYDGTALKNCRIYFDQTLADTYIASAAVQNGLMGGTIQGTALPFANFSTVSTVVGVAAVGDRSKSSPTFSDYTGVRHPPATIGLPIGITTTDGKTFFVLDNYSNRIHVVTVSNGVATGVHTLGTAGTTPADITFNSPSDITSDIASDGKIRLYVTDTSNYAIDKIVLDYDSTKGVYTGTFSVFAGSSGTSGALDGTGNTTTTSGTTTSTAIGVARFGAPVGITTDGTNLYVVDNDAVRKITLVPDGGTPQVTTLAGYLGSTGSANSALTDTTGINARFNLPLRITTDGTDLYVTDYYNYAIRKVSIATGRTTRIAGGTTGTYGTNSTKSVTSGDLALFNGPNGITTDGTNLYVTDWGSVIYGNPSRGQVIFRVSLALTLSGFSDGVTRIAGTQNEVGYDVGTVNVDSAYFCSPLGITTDGTSLYVTDSQNYTMRRIKIK